MDFGFSFDNSYGRLPARFFTRQAPVAVRAPKLLALNDGLAADLGLDTDALRSDAGVAVLAGNAVPDGGDPLAQVYAGHQFGGWSPQLGDGRAVLLGEHIGSGGVRVDVQLKGSGRTPYSRMGDGRAWLGQVLREYIVSEAMHAYAIPTTRALAAVATGETVQREAGFPGAILTRVAASHIRVGTFQYFVARGDTEALQALMEHVIARHYPDADGPLGLLDAVVAAQASLVAGWMALGFIHGVMNTDNMAVSGQTIDYGPCAFQDIFSPSRVFSSIDQHGRYAYNQQPAVAAWNLAQLATSLLPLMGDRDAAIEAATASVHRFGPLFQNAWLTQFRAKLGLERAEDGDEALVEGLLAAMTEGGADFTNVFRGLAGGTARLSFADPAPFDTWHADWQARLAREERGPDARAEAMRAANPAIIPRNHRIEEVIQAGLRGDLAPFARLTRALATPYNDTTDTADLARPPTVDQEVTQTFCGT
ncbi:MAG: YdiU family protein [Rhodobacteraceae bacterium]|nr:YdiU family protein [Paracoccaceae bacterium]